MGLNDFRAIFLPYCIKKEKGKYVVLNREYKPIGFRTNLFVDYSDYPIGLNSKIFTKRILDQISIEKEYDKNQVFLYNDKCIPISSRKNMENYLKKLEILARLKIK